MTPRNRKRPLSHDPNPADGLYRLAGYLAGVFLILIFLLMMGLTQAWLPKNMVFVNKAAFDALDKPAQEAVLAAARKAEARGWQMAQDKTKWYMEQIAAKGMKVLPPSPALKAGFQKVGEQLTQDWLKKAGADGQAVIDAYKKSM
ncbi:MAG TPA: hypothetical protein VLJ78_11035 [Microvirga sp.]|nr:hypothetical protein [Microvirga sp.]